MTLQNDSSVSRYISMVRSIPQLARAEEVELLRRWREHKDISARETLVRAHLQHVVSVVLRYRRYGLSISELIAEGNFAMAHALDKFEPSHGTRFVTYASYWIRAYVLNYVVKSWSLVGGGSGALRSKLFFKLRRERLKLTNQVGEGRLADQMLAQSLGLPEEKLQSLLTRLDARDVSIDAPIRADSAMTLGDVLVDARSAQDQILDSSERGEHVREVVWSAIARLDERERYIIEKRVMADPEDECSLAELGRQLGVSRERARQLESRAKRKLRLGMSELFRARGQADLCAA